MQGHTVAAARKEAAEAHGIYRSAELEAIKLSLLTPARAQPERFFEGEIGAARGDQRPQHHGVGFGFVLQIGQLATAARRYLRCGAVHVFERLVEQFRRV